MSLFVMPRKVSERLEIQRDFLWGGGSLENKPHLVRWEITCGEKFNWELEIKKISILKWASLGK